MTLPDHLPRVALVARQNVRLSELLRETIPANRFYAQKLAAAGINSQDIRTADDLTRVPFTTKTELSADQVTYPPYGQVLTYPVSRYVRFCQTSGTTSQPLRWLDTRESWSWLLDCWEMIYAIA